MHTVFWTFLAAFHAVVFTYFVVLNSYYLVMSIFAFRALRRYARRLTSVDVDDLIATAGAPPVTLIVPAYNEAETIVASTRSFLTLRYPDYEILIVNDGSKDGTLEALREAYDLIPAPRFPLAHIETAPVRGAYHSRTHPNLWVLDKENGKRADAINAGINHCRTPLLCIVDADGLLEPDALIRVARPFLEDEHTVASGGIIRIVNGCRVEDGLVREVRLPRNPIARFQVLEYLRSFLAGRVGWDALKIMFLVSGAFGLFRRSLVVEAGGLAPDSLGEDLELTVRLHRHCRERGIPYKIHFVPDPVAWTEAPETLKVLGRQRDRWQRGLIDTMIRHVRMLFNPRYGRIGLVAYPYFFFLEMIGPIVEFTGYLVFLTVLALGIASLPFALLFLFVAVMLGSVLSIAAVGLEELTFRRYTRLRDLLRLFLLAFAENLGYRQILTYYRLRGTISYFRGLDGWGDMERKGFEER
jgi:cellulose synthase/poly-beta-1,6-N-acetylglucosamine synthase-like glycosyltransferase